MKKLRFLENMLELTNALKTCSFKYQYHHCNCIFSSQSVHFQAHLRDLYSIDN